MKRLRSLWLLVMVLVPSAAMAQTRPWTVPYDFRIGQTSGFVTVVVRAVNDKTDEVLVEDTVNVIVKDWRFSGLIRVGGSDASSAQTMKDVYSLRVEYARASAPDTVLGTIRYGAPAYAMTLSPNAVIEKSSLNVAALDVSGGGVGLSALSTTSNAAISGRASSTTSTSFVAAVEGVSSSPSGAGGHFINTGNGQLIRAERDDGTGEFTVDADGTARTRGTAIPEFGPKGAEGERGNKGIAGDKGDKGDKGPEGDPAPIRSFGVAHTGNSCLGVCQGTARLINSANVGTTGCQLSSDQGPISNGVAGVCCVCGP